MPAERRGAISFNTMAFNPTASAPSPGTGGFTFAQPSATAAAATATTNLFGTTPAPSQGFFSGNAAPATATSTAPSSLFGNGTPASTPAPSSLFGTGTTASSSTPSSLFGTSTTANSSAPSSLFGTGTIASSPAPSAFGFTAPSTTAPPVFGAAGGFGAQPSNVPTSTNFAGFMSYSSLPKDQQSSIDSVYQAIMNHKRTILAVSSMAPKLLDKESQQADVAAGEQEEVGLPVTLERLTFKVRRLEQQMKCLHEILLKTTKNYEFTTQQATYNARYPTEFVAQRLGVKVIKKDENDKKASKDFDRQLKALLASEMNKTDQVSRMPSPYLWKTLEKMEERYRTMRGQVEYLKTCLDVSKEVATEEFDVIAVVQLQEKTIWKIGNDLASIHTKIDRLRQLYNFREKGTNVLERARQEEFKHQQQFNQQMRSMMVKSLPTTSSSHANAATPAPNNSLFGAPAPSAFGASSGGLFGSSTPAAAPGGGLFGKQAAAPVFGAPTTSNLFGAAPAPATGGLFGTTPAAPAPGFGAPATQNVLGAAPAPATGGLFGTTPAAPAPFGSPAPSTGNLFGSSASTTSAPPSATSTSIFGSASTTTTTPKSRGRSGNRRRR